MVLKAIVGIELTNASSPPLAAEPPTTAPHDAVPSASTPLVPTSAPTTEPAPTNPVLQLRYTEANIHPMMASLRGRSLHEVFSEFYNKKCHKRRAEDWSAVSSSDKCRVNMVVAVLLAVATSDEKTLLTHESPPGLHDLAVALQARFKTRLEDAERIILRKAVKGTMKAGGVEERLQLLNSKQDGVRDQLKSTKTSTGV